VTRRIDLGALPPDPLDGAARFFADHLGDAKAAARAGDVIFIFAPSDLRGREWRQGAVRDLARHAAPHRVNAVEGDAGAALEQAIDWLEGASAITGHYLVLADG
jgi:hypothetical protein